MSRQGWPEGKQSTRARRCDGCGLLMIKGATCVFGCGAWYHLPGRRGCAERHATRCPKIER